MIAMSSSVSCGVRTAVGSSRMSTRASRDSALMISTRCCTPTGMSSTIASGFTSNPNRSEISWTRRRARRASMRPAPFTGSCPSATFSATVNTGTSMKCWCTMPMPAAIASPGPANCTGTSSTRICPSSGSYSPYSTFMSVLLPALFSPSRAWISPGSMTRSMWSLATRDPKTFVIPRSSSFTGLPLLVLRSRTAVSTLISSRYSIEPHSWERGASSRPRRHRRRHDGGPGAGPGHRCRSPVGGRRVQRRVTARSATRRRGRPR